MAALHVSPYGGSWYPGRRAELERLLDELFADSERRTGPHLLANAVGFVVPHAGLEYSGTVAAAAYRHVREQKPRRVVILGFAHRGGPAGVSIPAIDGYETPLGSVRVDRDAVAWLAEHAPFQAVPESWICDHSLEIQLPLLQRAAPGATVVPLFVGRLDAAARDRAADILASMNAPDSVFLVSSDLTHYGRAFGYEPFAVDSAIGGRLEQLDGSVMEAAASLDADMFAEAVRESRATVCGVAPISLWLRTLAFVKGDVDMIEGAAVPGWFPSLKKQKPDAIFDYGRPGGTWTLFLNMARKPFDDIRVRQAIAHAIDPTAWLNAFGDFVEPMYGISPQGFYGSLQKEDVPLTGPSRSISSAAGSCWPKPACRMDSAWTCSSASARNTRPIC